MRRWQVWANALILVVLLATSHGLGAASWLIGAWIADRQICKRRLIDDGLREVRDGKA